MSTVPLFWKIALSDVGELREWGSPGLVAVPDLHVTLLYLGGKTGVEAAACNDMSAEDCQSSLEALQRMEGNEIDLFVTAVVKHPEMTVAKVELPNDIPCASFPHLTLYRSPAVAPKLAKEIVRGSQANQVCKISPPMKLRGVILLESGSHNRPIKAEIADPTKYVGKLLRVETNARASRQTEPSGHATFLAGSEAEVGNFANLLAASIKERPAGPDSLKFKAKVQAPSKPGHIYLKWGATANNLTAESICEILEARLQELM
mmetsp:Transcript_60379/g.95906  ORF Transcript_60379/g.95906 Transcript_60379/m.95906 type:complete len:262 (-) Transcript_60379:187-972(-)